MIYHTQHQYNVSSFFYHLEIKFLMNENKKKSKSLINEYYKLKKF